MRICYQDKRFRVDTLATIEIVNSIIAEYFAKGYSLTLRQVYYQMVARDLFPDSRRWSMVGKKWVRDDNGTKNAEPNYNWIGTIINDGRLAGLIDWYAITDRTRSLKGLSHWESPGDILNDAKSNFKMDTWVDQKYYVEVWVEKEALAEVVGMACNDLDISYFSCKGYTSQSAMWQAAMRLRDKYLDEGKYPVIIHLGDHDPSGIDMSRDIEERLEMFGVPPIFNRIALNMDQIEKYRPPPNPTKITDSRSKEYIDRFSFECWELDALDPETITELIKEEVEKWVDKDKQAEIIKKEYEYLQVLETIAGNWKTFFYSGTQQ